MDDAWEFTGWYRVVAPDGSTWGETSSLYDAEQHVRPGDTVMKLMKRTEYMLVRHYSPDDIKPN